MVPGKYDHAESWVFFWGVERGKILAKLPERDMLPLTNVRWLRWEGRPEARTNERSSLSWFLIAGR